ncbi:MAG TPA: hypothetical protein VFC63_13320 [Blastocatellia bacterium]|nr:hypothetical protein [Blastocatellia bacterium]
MPKILKGHLIALFAFDIGFEISLDKLNTLPASMAAPPLSKKKQTPAYLQYTVPPRIVGLGEVDAVAGRQGLSQATLFHFGAASIAYQWTISSEGGFDLEDLPKLSSDLYSHNLEDRARKQIEKLTSDIQSAIVRPEVAPLMEDYYLFIIEELDQPLRAKDLLSESRSTLAQVLRFETLPLSPDHQEEALNQRLSYYENDLVIVDWNAAIIYDRDYWDTVNVLELLNVELLEARYIDAQLDKRMGDYEGLVLKRADWLVPVRTPYKKLMYQLAELRLEALLLNERVDNALKLIGDLYLARVHAAAAKRLYLQEWETAISRKLDIIDSLYQLLTDRVRNAQSQTLELVVIALILVEIIIAIVAR